MKNQQQNTVRPVEMMTLPNGEQAVVLVQNPSKQLALIDLLTLQRIVGQLSTASFNEMREEFVDRINGTMGIVEYVQVIAEEYNFQTTVNLIRTIPIPKEEKALVNAD